MFEFKEIVILRPRDEHGPEIIRMRISLLAVATEAVGYVMQSSHPCWDLGRVVDSTIARSDCLLEVASALSKAKLRVDNRAGF